MHKVGLGLFGALYFHAAGLRAIHHRQRLRDEPGGRLEGLDIPAAVYDYQLPSVAGTDSLDAVHHAPLGGYEEYIGVSAFWSASKILLGLTLLWAYHTFAFLITFWYGRLEIEQNVLKYFFFEAYGGAFAANLFFSFILPFLILLWNPVRKTDWGPTLAGLSALGGAFIFNLKTFVGAFNAGDVYAYFFEFVPGPAWPDIWDIFMVVGGLGAAAFIYLAATRLFPILSVWETKEGAKYQKMDTLIRGRYLVLAKPE